ncbi:Retrotransposon-derived protein PEG10 [Smittium culicis]|uniref:Retrotransposon-derived protein PEG10 n=1 Tax=Smittium culicis TaxID=133412 RepID=A0A1R1YH14_9FUNG|nr:Retrotransposon-derived protein PEG10 [Smittium culicis]
MQASVPPEPIQAQVLAPVSPPAPDHTPQALFALPQRYDGNRSLFRGLVNQYRLLFFTNPDQYPTDVRKTANDFIHALRQGSNPVSMYASEFQRLMMDLDSNESATVSQFSEGLNENVLDTLALFQSSTDLEGFINSAITVDACLTRRKEEKARNRRGIQLLATSGPQFSEPIHVDATHSIV